MSVPDFQTLMLPVLQEYGDGKERVSREVRANVAGRLGLTAQDVAERLPTSPQTRFANRTAWAHSYLKQSGLLESPRRGHYRITERGRQLLAAPPARIDIPFLKWYPDFKEFRARKGTRSDAGSEDDLTVPATADDFDAAFTQHALTYAKTLQTTIVLVDGKQLAELMIEFRIGVSEVQTIRLQRVDEDYFTDETLS